MSGGYQFPELRCQAHEIAVAVCWQSLCHREYPKPHQVLADRIALFVKPQAVKAQRKESVIWNLSICGRKNLFGIDRLFNRQLSGFFKTTEHYI